MNKLLGVILCGGRSTRMGKPKHTLPHPDGGTFFDHAAKRISHVCHQVCLAGADESMSADVTILFDKEPFLGPVSGIAQALLYAQEISLSACLVTPIDMPNLNSEHLQQLVASWQQQPQLTVASSDRIEPLVGIYPVDQLQAVKQLLASEQRSLFRWIAGREHTTVKLPAQACVNVNSPEEFQQLERKDAP